MALPMLAISWRRWVLLVARNRPLVARDLPDSFRAVEALVFLQNG
ncbi:MAG: hypothetical protein WCA22_20975 [Candidatus Binatus sp.]